MHEYPAEFVGKYHKSGDAKRRVLAVANVDGDWKAAAIANGVPVQTAYGWIRKGNEPDKPRGGKRFTKVDATHVETMLEWLSENPLLTLKQIKDKLLSEET